MTPQNLTAAWRGRRDGARPPGRRSGAAGGVSSAWRLPTGDAKLTKGFCLSAKSVIRAVGPVWRSGTKGEPELLASCYGRSIGDYPRGMASTRSPSQHQHGRLRLPIKRGRVKVAVETVCSAVKEFR